MALSFLALLEFCGTLISALVAAPESMLNLEFSRVNSSKISLAGFRGRGVAFRAVADGGAPFDKY